MEVYISTFCYWINKGLYKNVSIMLDAENMGQTWTQNYIQVFIVVVDNARGPVLVEILLNI